MLFWHPNFKKLFDKIDNNIIFIAYSWRLMTKIDFLSYETHVIFIKN